MATSTFVNIRTTKLNDFNRFTVTHHEAGVSHHGPALFDFYLTDEEMTDLDTLVLEFAARIFRDREAR